MRRRVVLLGLLAGCVNLTGPEDLRDWHTSGKPDGQVASDGVPDTAASDSSPKDAAPADGPGTFDVGADAAGIDTMVTPDSPPPPPDAAPDMAAPPPDSAPVPDAPVVPPVGNPTLHWRFDETSGTVANDSSGNGYHGTYYGLAGSLPETSGMVPTVQFTNPASRAFTAGQRHQVRLYNPPAAVMPANSITATAWFRTRTIDSSNYSLILNVADGYFITLGQGEIWTARGVANARHQYCRASVMGFLDGRWHHVAAVWAPTGMKVYVDGTERCTNSEGQSIVYDAGLGILVGRRTSSYPYQFDGNIDDVRVYTRVLTVEQIQGLARGE